MANVLDGAVILILIGSIIWGYRRGFVKTAAQTIGCIAAIAIAFFLSGVVSQTVYDLFIDKPVKAYANQQMVDATDMALETQLDNTLDNMPKWTQSVLAKVGYGSSEEIMEKLRPDADATVAEIVDDIVRPPLLGILRLIVFFILFMILMLVVLLISKMLRRIFRFPFLRQVDGVLGIIPGIIYGVLWVMALTMALQLYVSLAAKTPGWLTEQTLQDTVLVRLAIEWNPLTATVQSFFA